MELIESTFLPDLIYLLEQSGLNLTYGTNVFKGPKAKIPQGSGPYVSVISIGGLGVEGTHNSPDVPAYEMPGAQILVRATHYDDAATLTYTLYRYLFPVRDRFVNGTWWRSLTIRGTIFDLPPDEKDRARVAFNLDCVKRTSPAT